MFAERYRRIFPRALIGEQGYQTNTELIEFAKIANPDFGNTRKKEWRKEFFGGGSFKNTTTPDGAVTGFGMHIGVIDDPLKGHSQADSKNNRDKVWDWIIDDLMTRLDEMNGLLIIGTRWHVDDPIGRIIKQFGSRVVQARYKAIATENEPFRRKGDALFPAYKSKKFLSARRAERTKESWEALYQQSPFVSGGGKLPINKLHILPEFDRSLIVSSVRYWDKAGTGEDEDGGSKAAYTAGVLMYKLRDGRFLISDIVRGRWEAMEREQIIEQTSRLDHSTFRNYRVFVEREPGSGGKESAENTIRKLAGLNVAEDLVGKSSGNKEVRAEPFSGPIPRWQHLGIGVGLADGVQRRMRTLAIGQVQRSG